MREVRQRLLAVAITVTALSSFVYAPAVSTAAPAAAAQYAELGDSYSSGEGLSPYEKG